MARLRIVSSGHDGAPPEERSFADAARAMLEQALAEGAVVLALIVETPQVMDVRSVPDSTAVRLGLVRIARDLVAQEGTAVPPEGAG